MGITLYLLIALFLISLAVAVIFFVNAKSGRAVAATVLQRRICGGILATEAVWVLLFFIGNAQGALFLPACFIVGACGLCYPVYLLLKKVKCGLSLLAFLLGLFMAALGLLSLLISSM